VMGGKDWRYYNHALLPQCAPHEKADITLIENDAIWGLATEGAVLFARWTSDFDCPDPTEWWWCIADKPLDLSKLKAKRRYEHKKAAKNFVVKKIEPINYIDELRDVRMKAFSAYPSKYRPNIEAKEQLIEKFSDNSFAIYAAFYDGKIAGYVSVKDNGSHLLYNEQKTNPSLEKYGVNLSLVDAVLQVYAERLNGDFYIVDGERSVNHQTNFQDYLIKYAGFRRVYCRLNIKVNPQYRYLINIAYRFRWLLCKFDFVGIIHKINAVLKMYSIARNSSI